MDKSDFDDTLRTVVVDGLVVCLNSFENVHTNLYLLLQHLRCLVEDTKGNAEFDGLNDSLYAFYSAVSAAHSCLSEVDGPVREFAEWLDSESDDEDDDKD